MMGKPLVTQTNAYLLWKPTTMSHLSHINLHTDGHLIALQYVLNEEQCKHTQLRNPTEDKF